MLVHYWLEGTNELIDHFYDQAESNPNWLPSVFAVIERHSQIDRNFD